MTDRPDAPLCVQSEALLAWLLTHIRRWPPVARRLVGEPLLGEARAVLGAAVVALAFPERRAAALADADAALARLRAFARMATLSPPLLDAGAEAELIEQTHTLGRMLGGWQRSVGRRCSASSAAARGAVSPSIEGVDPV